MLIEESNKIVGSAVSNENTSIHLDDVLIKFNIFGLYYFKVIMLLIFGSLCHGMFCLNYVFVAEQSGYRCKDERFINNMCSSITEINNTEVFCTEWIYDNPNSFVAELACQEWKRTLIGTVHSTGYMIGLLIIGPLSDKLGRKNLIVLVGVIGAIIGIARSFTTYYWMYIALEFLEAAIGDNSSPLFMFSMEVVANEKRLLFQLLCGVGFSLSFTGLSTAAWLFPYWRHLLRAIYSLAILFAFYFFLLEENPRWLLSKGRKEEAIKILKSIRNKCKAQIDDNILSNISLEESKEIKFSELLLKTFTSRELLKRFFICVLWWLTCTFVNYGMQINSVSLEGNKYINFGLLSLMELTSNIIIITVLSYFGRKRPLICSFFLAAIFCFVQPFIPLSLPWISVAIFMIGKFMSSTFFTTTYIYTSELFPTYTRNSMHALCSSLGRFGSILAPQIPLLSPYWRGLPSMAFGVASVCAGIATLWAPDLANDHLPDTVHQAEALGKQGTKNDDVAFVPTSFRENITRL